MFLILPLNLTPKEKMAMTNKLLYGLHVNQASNTKTSEKNVMAHGDTIDALRYYDHEELLTIVKGIAIDIDSLKHKH